MSVSREAARILCHTFASLVTSINRFTPALAITIGVLHASLASVLAIDGMKPNLLLVATVLVAARAGFLPAATWAFLGGLAANLMSAEPLGAIPLVLLLVAAATAAGRSIAPWAAMPYAVLAVMAGSIFTDAGMGLIRGLMLGVPWDRLAIGIALTAAAVNAAIALAVLLAARLVARRRPPEPAAGKRTRWPV